jgi:CubicO group peptidase (beta-lactamase class C family)
MKPIVTGKRTIWSACGLALALTLSIGASAANPDGKPATEAGRPQIALAARGKFVDQRIADFMTRNNLPGLTMAIVQAPYIPRSAGYGRASIIDDQLASTRTMWNIGPVTQGFTTVAIFQLYEADKLDIHDAVENYVPGIPAAWGGITIFQLLQHASGIPDYRRSPEFNVSQKYRPADLLALVSGKPLLFKSGTQVHMSATDYILLGLVIERAGGMPFREYITKFQIEPLGLHSTMFAEDFSDRSFLDRRHVRFKSEIPYIDPVEPAVGYREENGKLIAVDGNASESSFAFGAIWSSAEDISIWDIALAGSTLVKSQENRALIYQPTKLENGTTYRPWRDGNSRGTPALWR